MKPEECWLLRAVMYSPSPGHRFRGTVAEEPWQLGCGTWVTKLIHMEPAYAEFTHKTGDKATTVHAAALRSMEPAPDRPIANLCDEQCDTYRRILRWLDAEEGRTLTLVSANADFGGPSHCIEYSTLDHEPKQVFGESRQEIMGKIEELTR